MHTVKIARVCCPGLDIVDLSAMHIGVHKKLTESLGDVVPLWCLRRSLIGHAVLQCLSCDGQATTSCSCKAINAVVLVWRLWARMCWCMVHGITNALEMLILLFCMCMYTVCFAGGAVAGGAGGYAQLAGTAGC